MIESRKCKTVKYPNRLQGGATSFAFFVKWKDDSPDSRASSEVIGFSKVYARYVQARAQQARRDGTDGDAISQETEERRALNSISGLMQYYR